MNNSVFDNSYSLKEWKESKRKETLNLILKEEYGLRSSNSNIKLQNKVLEERVVNKIKIQKVSMLLDNYEMPFYVYIPNDGKKHKAFILVMHEYAEDKISKDIFNEYKSNYLAPIDDIIDRGYAIAIMPTRAIARDIKTSFYNKSIFKALNEKRTNHSWSVLQAWSWGASKVLDYLETLPEIDATKVAVIGHSRGGKTAIIAAAQDERFFLSVSSCSGNSGAAISRGCKGETIANITEEFPYWFARNYKKYAGNEDKLPFDQHQLIGCIAPRNVYVFSGNGDPWASPENELKSCRLASQYFELYGKQGFVGPENIELDKSYNEGNIAYHIKTGIHSLEPRDWTMVMDYFDKISK